MSLLDYILIGVIILALALAGRVWYKNRKQGSTCGGNCAHCNRSCAE